MRICYVSKRFLAAGRQVIEQANEILEEYDGQGYILTLRQLYYQFVARDLIANKQSEYKRLGSIINDARLAGLVDWNHLEDRTRSLKDLGHWDDPADIIRSSLYSFRISRWDTQPFYVEVWIEKDALAGVFERICNELDVPYFSCRGYTSQSELWRAAIRLQKRENGGQESVILHFGDHDPSGIDMTRDIEDRLRMFGSTCEVRRLALNMDQVEEHTPPPNPAKITDPRAKRYIAELGDESWELDALEPSLLSTLVEETVEDLIDRKRWNKIVKLEDKGKKELTWASENWNVIPWIRKNWEDGHGLSVDFDNDGENSGE